MATVNTAARAVDRLTEATNALNDPAVFQAAKHMGIGEQLADLVWRVGNLAAQIDPYAGFPEPVFEDEPHPFATALEQSFDPAETGQCDHCGGPYVLGADDHNPETGNHYECERGQG